MRAKPLRATAAACFLLLLGPISAAAVEVSGGSCVAVSSDYFIWSDYNEVVHRAGLSGKPTDAETMRASADRVYRTSWKSLEWEKWALASGIAVRTGFVKGAENSRWGAIPRDADIEVGVLADWSVSDVYSWLLEVQPRVEVDTSFQMSSDYRGGISFKNDIRLFASGFISGTTGNPRPQLGRHSVHLLAVDINGKAWEALAQLNASAVPSTSEGDTTGGFDILQVSGTVNISKDGLSGGGGIAYSKASSYNTTDTTTVPEVPAAKASRSFPGQAQKSVALDCGQGVKLRRVAQVSADLETASYVSGATISTTAAYKVSNSLKAVVSCVLCDDGDDDDDPEDPSPEGGEDGDEKKKPIKTYGARERHPLDPVRQNNLVFTPVHGGSMSPRSFWNDPLSDRVGSIYVTRKALPDFIVPLPESRRERAGEVVKEGKIPLLMPDVDWTHVAIADIGETPTLEPGEGTNAFLLPWLQQIVFDGPFTVSDPRSKLRQRFAGAGFIEFPTSARPTVPGGVEVVLGRGEEIRSERQGSRTTHTVINRRSGEVTGAYQEDDQHPDVIFFDRSLYRPVPDGTHSQEVDPPVQRPEGAANEPRQR